MCLTYPASELAAGYRLRISAIIGTRSGKLNTIIRQNRRFTVALNRVHFLQY